MNIIPDWKVLLVQIGGFALVLLVFKLYLFKPIQDLLDARRQEVEKRYEDADEAREQADELRAQYEQRLASVEDEMRARITEAVKEGQTVREEILADTRAQADGILTKAQEEIQRERDSAITELKSTVANLAVDAAGKLIQEKLDPKKHRELVDRYIDELDEVAQ